MFWTELAVGGPDEIEGLGHSRPTRVLCEAVEKGDVLSMRAQSFTHTVIHTSYSSFETYPHAYFG